MYDFGAYWECDIRLEALLPLTPRVSIRCVSGANGRRRPRTAGAPGAIWSGLISIAVIRPLEAMGVAADAVSRC